MRALSAKITQLWFEFRLWVVRRVLFRDQALVIGCAFHGCTAHIRNGKIRVTPYRNAAVVAHSDPATKAVVMSDCRFTGLNPGAAARHR